MEVISDKEYQQRQSRKGCLTVLVLAVIIGSLFYYQGDKKPDKTKTEVVSEKSHSVGTKTEEPIKSHVVLEEDNPAPVDENVEENKEKEEIVNEDVSSKEEVKSISIDELVKSYQNNQDQ
jgi:hypothetical protein